MAWLASRAPAWWAECAGAHLPFLPCRFTFQVCKITSSLGQILLCVLYPHFQLPQSCGFRFINVFQGFGGIT